MDWIEERVGEKNVRRVVVIRTCNHEDDALLGVTKPITVWKKVAVRRGGGGCWLASKVIPLLLLPDTKVWVHRWEDKCRANFAIAGDFQTGAGNTCNSGYDCRFEYKPGMVVIPNHFSSKPDICASGVHFYFTRGLAKRH